MLNKAKIAIVGGGYSGMAAAIRVVECGGVPTVFEAGRILGGRARRVEYQGRTLDNGQHILSGAYRELLRLMDVIGLTAGVYDRVPLRLSMPPNFLLRAPLLPAPLHMAVALLTARGLSLIDRFKAVRMMIALKNVQFCVGAKLTVADLLLFHNQSQNLIDKLWQPLTVAALNTPIATASAQVFANVLQDALAGEREASDLLLPKVDLTALFPEPAAAWLRQQGGLVNLGQRVTSIVPTDENVAVTIPGKIATFDAVIIAVGPHQRDDFLSVIGTCLPESSPALTFEPITTVYFGFDSAHKLASAMFGQSHGIANWFFDRRQLSRNPQASELVVSAVISASGTYDAIENDHLAAQVLTELKQFAPWLPDPAWQKVIREKFATFACTPDAPRPSHLTASPRVFLAGDDVANPVRNYPATLEGAVRNGVAAADAARRFIQTKND